MSRRKSKEPQSSRNNLSSITKTNEESNYQNTLTPSHPSQTHFVYNRINIMGTKEIEDLRNKINDMDERIKTRRQFGNYSDLLIPLEKERMKQDFYDTFSMLHKRARKSKSRKTTLNKSKSSSNFVKKNNKKKGKGIFH